MEMLNNIVSQTWGMIAEMGPYLLLGLAISVLLHKYLRKTWILKLMGRRNLSSVMWGSVVGVPMPLCSCGVIPVTMSLHAKGASKGATTSFLTSTPQTGVDSFLATYGMLGPVFAFYKLVVAFVSGILVGLVTDLFDGKTKSTPTKEDTSLESEKTPTFPESFRYGFYTMPGDLSGSLLLGFVLAGLIAALAPADLLAGIPGGALSAILLATAISIPFYICSTGSIPLALALVHSGLPISAALVLLIAGPATNIATITAMRKVLGGRSTFIYVTGVILTTWIAAAVYHFYLDTGTLGDHSMAHEMDLSWWKHLGGALLLLVLIFPIIRNSLSKSKPSTDPVSPSLNQHTLHIDGMNCSHCENSVKSGLSAVPELEVISVDKDTCTALVQTESLNEEVIREKMASLGFEYQGSK